MKFDFVFAAVTDESGEPVPDLACYTKYEWSEYPYKKCSGISMQSGFLPIHIYRDYLELDEITFILANTSVAGELITQEFTLSHEQMVSREIIPL